MNIIPNSPVYYATREIGEDFGIGVDPTTYDRVRGGSNYYHFVIGFADGNKIGLKCIDRMADVAVFGAAAEEAASGIAAIMGLDLITKAHRYTFAEVFEGIGGRSGVAILWAQNAKEIYSIDQNQEETEKLINNKDFYFQLGEAYFLINALAMYDKHFANFMWDEKTSSLYMIDNELTLTYAGNYNDYLNEFRNRFGRKFCGSVEIFRAGYELAEEIFLSKREEILSFLNSFKCFEREPANLDIWNDTARDRMKDNCIAEFTQGTRW